METETTIDKMCFDANSTRIASALWFNANLKMHASVHEMAFYHEQMHFANIIWSEIVAYAKLQEKLKIRIRMIQHY